MAALLTSVLENTDKMLGYISECQKMGIRVLPPSINESGTGFTVSKKGIRFGLPAVKNVGRGFVQRLVQERETNGIYSDLHEFCQRLNGIDLNKRTVESLIKSGAMDCLPHNRKQMLASYEAMIDSINTEGKNMVEGQLDLFHIGAIEKPKFQIPALNEFPQDELLEMEKEMIGLFLSANPLERYSEMAKLYHCTNIIDILDASDDGTSFLKDRSEVTLLGTVVKQKTIQTRKGSRMAFVNLEDQTGIIEVTFFPSTYSSCAERLKEGKILIIRGALSLKEEEVPKVLCSSFLFQEDFGKLLSASEKQEAEKQILFCRLDSREDQRGTGILNLLQQYPGQNTAGLIFMDTGKKVKIPFKIDFSKADEFIPRLLQLLPSEDIIWR